MIEKIEIDDTNLRALLKALGSPVSIRIGILGGKNSRSGPSDSNATVGAAHEFGTSSMPRRSFLVDPLQEKLQEYVEKSRVFDDDATAEAIKTRSIKVWLRKLAVLAESVVQDAFSTGGFGKWAPWKNPKYRNNTGQLLINTQQLRNSITSEVKNG